MISIVTPSRMAEIDAAAADDVDQLIDLAGAAIARAAIEMLGGTYGRRVVVLAGPGNNGADGRVAAKRLRARGVRCQVVDALEQPSILPTGDLYVDAAFGTGLSRPYTPPARSRPDASVLAVDIPSGLDGLTGRTMDSEPWCADRTITFAALKPGLLLHDGPRLSGQVSVVDIGLEATAHPLCGLLADDDVEPLPTGGPHTHKWHEAALVIAGSQGMGGAAALTCAAAIRSGVRMLHLSAPPSAVGDVPVEVVRSEPPLTGSVERFSCLAVGPGLGRDDAAAARLVEALKLPIPAVVDADALAILGSPEFEPLLAARSAPTVLTPHDGEFAALTGSAPGDDRIVATRDASAQLGVTVLLKGGPIVVADPDGTTFVSDSGSARLAAAGSGDVLTGMILGRLCAFGGAKPAWRAAEAAHLHGRAAAAIPGSRLVAGDLVSVLGEVVP